MTIFEIYIIIIFYNGIIRFSFAFVRYFRKICDEHRPQRIVRNEDDEVVCRRVDDARATPVRHRRLDHGRGGRRRLVGRRQQDVRIHTHQVRVPRGLPSCATKLLRKVRQDPEGRLHDVSRTVHARSGHAHVHRTGLRTVRRECIMAIVFVMSVLEKEKNNNNYAKYGKSLLIYS